MKVEDRAVLNTLRIVRTIEVRHELYEVCATASGMFDDEGQTLVVSLDSFVRRFEMRGEDLILHPSWLPRSDKVRTQVESDEAAEAAKDIFGTWAEKVKKTIPPNSEWERHPPWLAEAGSLRVV